MNMHFPPVSPTTSPYSSIKENSSALDHLTARVNALRPEQFDLSQADVKTRLLENLQDSYAALSKCVPSDNEPLSSQARSVGSTLFYLYGRCCYGGDMVASKQPLLLALGLMLKKPPQLIQDAAASILKEVLKTHPTLAEAASALGTSQAQDSTIPLNVSQMGEKLNQLDQSILIGMVNAMDKESAFEAALAFRWLGATWHNLEGTNKDHSRLKNVYAVAETVARHLMEHSPREDLHDQWLVADIIYNTRRTLYAMQHPEDAFLGQLLSLEELQMFLNQYPNTPKKRELEAQTHNIKGVLLRDWNEYSTSATEAGRKNQLDAYGKTPLECLHIRYKEVTQASGAANETPGFNPFLQIMFTNNKLSTALELKRADATFVLDLDEAARWYQSVTNAVEGVDYLHADAATLQTKGHYYHAIFCLTAARFDLHRGRVTEAKQWLDLGLVICGKFPNSSEEIRQKVEHFIQHDFVSARIF